MASSPNSPPPATSSHVQFGCGLCAPAGWTNFDAGPAFWLQHNVPFLKPLLVQRGFPEYPANVGYGNVVTGLPVAAGSASAVYCSHVLEHLALDDLRRTLHNVLGYLRTGGTFRLVLPDLAFLVAEYSAGMAATASSRFMRESLLGTESSANSLGKLASTLFGRSAHLWMWDEKGLAFELADAGFVGIRRAQMGDNPDPMFREVEEAGRWVNCLGMECRRP